ncbi:hypothetical protein NKI88_20055, partial [Mesorhizobium sp. M0317]|uniref:hypothetical protein n=1 Tax=Mesorhizobium sp. M0317 TaxID=2956935 RepID=UPI0033351A50
MAGDVEDPQILVGRRIESMSNFGHFHCSSLFLVAMNSVGAFIHDADAPAFPDVVDDGSEVVEIFLHDGCMHWIEHELDGGGALHRPTNQPLSAIPSATPSMSTPSSTE